MHRLKHKVGGSGSLIKNRLCSLLKSQNEFNSAAKFAIKESNCNGIPVVFSSSTIGQNSIDVRMAEQVALKSSSVSRVIANAKWMKKGISSPKGTYVSLRGWQTRECTDSLLTPHQLNKYYGRQYLLPCFARSLASSSASQSGQNGQKQRKDITTVDDPFDAPTYNIPEKPVTFTEGASYSLIILVGLGIAAAAGYAVFKELIFEPKEYKIFGKALDRVQNEIQVKARIGSPITGYGQESRNRAARQRIPNKIWTDDDGLERVEVSFHIRGPHGAGKVYSEMFKDKVDKQWKFMYLVVELNSPTKQQLLLESYVPA